MGQAWTAHDTSTPSLLDTWFCLDRKHVFFDCGRFRILIENGVFHVVTNWNDKLFKCMDVMEIHTAKEETEKKALDVHQTLEHNKIFDKPKYDQGDMYKKYTFKYESEK